MEQLINELETYIKENNPSSTDTKLKELQSKIINEYKKNHDESICGKIKLDNLEEDIFFPANNNKSCHFIIPKKDRKLYNMIVDFNDYDTGLFYGIENYIKQLNNIYKKILELGGIVLIYV